MSRLLPVGFALYQACVSLVTASSSLWTQACCRCGSQCHQSSRASGRGGTTAVVCTSFFLTPCVKPVTALEFWVIIRFIYYFIYLFFKHISFCLWDSFHLFLRRLPSALSHWGHLSCGVKDDFRRSREWCSIHAGQFCDALGGICPFWDGWMMPAQPSTSCEEF